MATELEILREALKIIRTRTAGRRYANVKGLQCIRAIADAALTSPEAECAQSGCGMPKKNFIHSPAETCKGCKEPHEHHPFQSA